MKTNFFVIIIALLFASAGVKAQNKARSITFGFSPIGYNHVNINLDDEKYKYDYKSYWNANIGYEKQFKGVVSLTEFTYSHATFDKYDLTGTSEWFNPAQTEDLTTMSITTYAGKTINPNKRIQFPVYIGIGGEYLNGGPMHNLAIDLALKARVKFYFTNSIGIYVGATGKVGYGMKSASEKSASSKEYYSVIPSMLMLDAGMVITL
ncbi:MAG: DUF2715 domain-containing protein [Prevotella sp.]|nr:DUF2715 domain-containing protein [Prevotella sp.]